jgi:hypothetical protein
MNHTCRDSQIRSPMMTPRKVVCQKSQLGVHVVASSIPLDAVKIAHELQRYVLPNMRVSRLLRTSPRGGRPNQFFLTVTFSEQSTRTPAGVNSRDSPLADTIDPFTKRPE